jgi:hypothetical membrane protein
MNSALPPEARHQVKLNDDRVTRFLLLCGVLAPIMLASVIFIVGQITPDYNPVSDTVSQSGTPDSPYSVVLNAGFVVYGISMCGVAGGFYRRLRYAPIARVLAILLIIHGVSSILLALFPDSLDFPGKHFTEDMLHNVFSAVSYAAELIGMLVFAKIAYRDKRLKAVAILGLAVVAFNLPLPMVTMLDLIKPISGLLQRLFTAGWLLWLIVTSLSLYRMTVVESAE